MVVMDRTLKVLEKCLVVLDLVVMENGQYDKNWPNIHIMPEEVKPGGC